ncbi:MAG: CRTAC1 family protein [Planctomycetota bacterium]
MTVFADFDNDGVLDALVARNLDYHREGFVDDGTRTGWMRGNGDGTFGPEINIITAAPAATTLCAAVADVDLDGWLDLFLGNSYLAYGSSYEGFPNDLLMQAVWPISSSAETGAGATTRQTWVRRPLPSDGEPFTMDEDLGGRPTYGAIIAWLDADASAPHLIELSYGRRWNRAWAASGPEDNPTLRWEERARKLGIDGDEIRHGRYPEWTKQLFRERFNVEREDEQPFRANGNTFDASVGDIDNDGDFDLFITEITHGWAGDSSDRTAFAVNRQAESGELRFERDPALSVDRVPEDTDRWNQGDLFSALADLNHDGHLDLLISSGDYPDDQRLRFYRGTADGTFVEATSEVGLDHDGSQQLSLADFDRDGDLDILVGQTFFRYTTEMREGRQPRMRLFMNESPGNRHALVLRFDGRSDLISVNEDTEPANRRGLGVIVRMVSRSDDGTEVVQQRQLVGIGGHAGKQNDFIVHFGLADDQVADRLEVVWPNEQRTTDVFEQVQAGEYLVRIGGGLERVMTRAP